MKWLKKISIRCRFSNPPQQDVAQGILQKDSTLLLCCIRYGAYPERAAAAKGLGQIKAKFAVPELIRLLWDDFETVAKAARKGLEPFVPNDQIEQKLAQATQFWAYKENLRPLKRNVIWYNTNKPLPTASPLIDKSKMQMLGKVKGQLTTSIRFW